MDTTTREPLACACGSDDLAQITDYGRGDGRWECEACGGTVYRMDGHVWHASARTMRAAKAAQDSVPDEFDNDEPETYQ